MRFLWRWARENRSDPQSEGSVLFAIANACDSVRFGAVDDEALALKCNAIVRKGLDKHAISYEAYRTWREKNRLIFTSVVDSDGALIGFFDLFPLQPDSAKAMLKGQMNERSLDLVHIMPLQDTANAEYVHIATIMVDLGQKSFTPMVAREALLMQFKKFLDQNFEPLEDKVFTAYAQSKAGEAVLRRAGFSAVVLPKNSGQGATLYVLRLGANQEAFLRFARAEYCITRKQTRSDTLSCLDKRIDAVERELRAIIGGRLDNRFDRIPANVASKIQERVTAAVKKDALFESARMQRISEWLEFADPRELQDIILNKLLWSNFNTVFQSESVTELRFGQMAELRNCLRHSRHVGPVVEKEGEAAIMWFEEVHKKTK